MLPRQSRGRTLVKRRGTATGPQGTGEETNSSHRELFAFYICITTLYVSASELGSVRNNDDTSVVADRTQTDLLLMSPSGPAVAPRACVPPPPRSQAACDAMRRAHAYLTGRR